MNRLIHVAVLAPIVWLVLGLTAPNDVALADASKASPQKSMRVGTVIDTDRDAMTVTVEYVGKLGTQTFAYDNMDGITWDGWEIEPRSIQAGMSCRLFIETSDSGEPMVTRMICDMTIPQYNDGYLELIDPAAGDDSIAVLIEFEGELLTWWFEFPYESTIYVDEALATWEDLRAGMHVSVVTELNENMELVPVAIWATSQIATE